jgi:hypothetical protein
MSDLFTVHMKKLTPILEEYGVTYLALFGSQARNEATENSDIDLLIDYQKPLGLIKFARLERTLSELLKKNVDLVSKNGMSKHMNPYIQKDLQVIYEKK